MHKKYSQNSNKSKLTVAEARTLSLKGGRSRYTTIAASAGLIVVLALLWVQNTASINSLVQQTLNIITPEKVVSRQSDTLPAPTKLNSSSSSEVVEVEVPKDFPLQVPLFPGAVVDASRSMVAQRSSWTVDIQTHENKAQAVTYIKKLFSDKGWITDSELIDEQGITYAVSKQNLAVVVYAMSQGKQTLIKYTVTEQIKL